MRKFQTHERELKRLTARFFQMISSAADSKSHSTDDLMESRDGCDKEELLNAFKAELLRFSIVTAKDIKVRNVYFEKKRQKLQAQVSQQKTENQEMEQKIVQLHEKLDQTRTERQRKIEYDRVAKMIQEYPTVEQTSKYVSAFYISYYSLNLIS